MSRRSGLFIETSGQISRRSGLFIETGGQEKIERNLR
jgi:hypothetical protein